MRLLFQSKYFATYQSDAGRCFYVDFNGKMVKLKFCQLLALRQQVKKINIEAHFNGLNNAGVEILVLCNREHVFIVDTLQALDLQDMVQNTFGVLELNSLLAAPV